VQLRRYDEESRLWVPGQIDDGIRLVPIERGVAVVLDPTASIFLGGRPTPPVVLAGEAELEFCVGRTRFRLIVHPPLEEFCFEAGESAISCARCKGSLASGDRVSRCRCGALLHEGPTASGGEPLHCFTYAPGCPACGLQEDSDA
jgi:hypothetical protein